MQPLKSHGAFVVVRSHVPVAQLRVADVQWNIELDRTSATTRPLTKCVTWPASSSYTTAN